VHFCEEDNMCISVKRIYCVFLEEDLMCISEKEVILWISERGI